MIERFYSDLVSDDEVIRDSEGVEADSIEQAVAEAGRVIFEMREVNELPVNAMDWELRIRDEAGSLLTSIRLG